MKMIWAAVAMAAVAKANLIDDPLNFHLEPNADFVSEQQYFPTEVSVVKGMDIVKLCIIDKIEQEDDVSKRPFDKATEDCKFVSLKDLESHVESNCPEPTVSLVHHMPHAGSTLMASMLESAPNVRTWSEYEFFNKIDGRQKENLPTYMKAFACSREGAPEVKNLVIKLSSSVSLKKLDEMRNLFPESSWMFLFRQPADVLANLCAERTPEQYGLEEQCQYAGKKVNLVETYFILERMMDQADKSLRSSVLESGKRTGLAIDYANLLDNVAQVLRHLEIDLTPEELEAVMEVAKYDPKLSKKEGRPVPYSSQKETAKAEKIANDPLLKQMADGLTRSYDRLRDYEASATMKSVAEPATFPLTDIFRYWDPKDSALPTKIAGNSPARHVYNSLTVFTDLNQKEEMREYQINEVPFLLRSGKIASFLEQFDSEFMATELTNKDDIKVERSSNRRHMYYSSKEFEENEVAAPTQSSHASFTKFAEQVAVEAAKPMVERDTVYGIIHQGKLGFLDAIDDAVNANLAYDHSSKTKLQCKIGMAGILNEAHFDRSRNLVTMIDGVKRWVILPPKEAGKVGLAEEGPYYRHATFDWADEANWGNFEGVQAIDVVLRAGDVMYLPSGWVHYVISLDEVNDAGVNFQCNSWVGKESFRNDEELNFPDYRADKTVCLDVMKQCAYLQEDCFKDSSLCRSPAVMYDCFQTALQAEQAERPELSCPKVSSTIMYYASLCHILPHYDTSSCPHVNPKYIDKVRASLFQPKDSIHRRRLAISLTDDSTLVGAHMQELCDMTNNLTYEERVRNTSIFGYKAEWDAHAYQKVNGTWTSSNASYDDQNTHFTRDSDGIITGHVESSKHFWSGSEDPLPNCQNGTSFSDLFGNSTHYACELNSQCNDFIIHNDLFNYYAFGMSLEYLGVQSDESEIDMDLMIFYDIDETELGYYYYFNDYDGEIDFDFWYYTENVDLFDGPARTTFNEFYGINEDDLIQSMHGLTYEQFLNYSEYGNTPPVHFTPLHPNYQAMFDENTLAMDLDYDFTYYTGLDEYDETGVNRSYYQMQFNSDSVLRAFYHEYFYSHIPDKYKLDDSDPYVFYMLDYEGDDFQSDSLDESREDSDGYHGFGNGMRVYMPGIVPNFYGSPKGDDHGTYLAFDFSQDGDVTWNLHLELLQAPCTDVDTPHPGCIQQECQYDADTPYTGCIPVDCTGDDEPAGCIRATCTGVDTPHAGCIEQSCTDNDTPYVGCVLEPCTAVGVPDFCVPQVCVDADSPYEGCAEQVCTDVDTPYAGCLQAACTAADTPYEGCAYEELEATIEVEVTFTEELTAEEEATVTTAFCTAFTAAVGSAPHIEINCNYVADPDSPAEGSLFAVIEIYDYDFDDWSDFDEDGAIEDTLKAFEEDEDVSPLLADIGDVNVDGEISDFSAATAVEAVGFLLLAALAL